MGVSENGIYTQLAFIIGEHDDNPMDLELHKFQTKPYNRVDFML